MRDIPEPALAYLAEQKTMTLATASSSGVPHAATFMYANDGPILYFWARPTSETARQLRLNDNVAFTIDEYVDDFNKAKGIQGTGTCEPVTDHDDLATAIGLIGDKFPAPGSGASTANISFYKVTPHSLQFIDNEGTNVRVEKDDFGMDFHRELVFSD